MRWFILLLAGAIHAQTFSADLFPTILLAPIQLITLAMLFWCIFKQPHYAIRYSLLFSIAHFCTGIYWLFISMHTYGHLAAPLAATAVLFLSFYLSLYPVLAGIIFRLLHRNTLHASAPSLTAYQSAIPSSAIPNISNAILMASAWALGEWLRGSVLTGFPWLNIAYAHVDSPLGGWASILGAYGVAWLTALVAALLATGIQHSTWKPWLLIATVLLTGQLIKNFSWSSPIGDPLSVRLIQGNIDQHDKFDPVSMLPSMMKNFELAARPAQNPLTPPKVVIFPETVIPVFQNQLSPAIWQQIIDLAGSQQATYFIGSPYARETSTGTPTITNSILIIDGNTSVEALYYGEGIPHYDKRHLVPFGEYIPRGFHWFVHALGIPLGDFSLGEELQANILINQQVLAPNICYEDIFGEELLNDLLPAAVTTPLGTQPYPGTTILLNASNLSWFGNSSALGQHLQMARMRTKETARPMLRATNTGATAYIDEQGNIIASLPYAQAGILDVNVQGMTGLTPYVQFRNIPFFILVVFSLLFSLIQKCKTHRSYTV